MKLQRGPYGHGVRLTIGRRGWLLNWGEIDDVEAETVEWSIWIARPGRHTVYVWRGRPREMTDDDRG